MTPAERELKFVLETTNQEFFGKNSLSECMRACRSYDN